MTAKSRVDVVIVGAGAAGMMCAIEAGKRGRSVCVIEHNDSVGKKIRISGGGRCNFTNVHTSPENFVSGNPHFCKSALSRYTPQDFITLVERRRISYHEKKAGQLFCDGSAQQIIDMLCKEMVRAGVRVETQTTVQRIEKERRFLVETSKEAFRCDSLVIATGGLSVPKLGATNFGHRIASQFGLRIIQPSAALVPFTFNATDRVIFAPLSGVSVEALVKVNGVAFHENILFTHRGISGPAILQASLYRRPGDVVEINLLPNFDAMDFLSGQMHRRALLPTVLSTVLPKRFADVWCNTFTQPKPMHAYSATELRSIAAGLTSWRFSPAGTEGYRTAEVTSGGVDTRELSSKTMESRSNPGLYFIGEVVDVTGQLGGYNFQWAWASGWAAGQSA